MSSRRSRISVLAVLLGLVWCVPASKAQTWTELSPTGSPPDPFFGPKPVHYDAVSNRLILFFPGNVGSGGYGNQVWILTNANGLGGPAAWTQLATTGTPPASNSFESVVYDGGTNRLVVYGGCQVGCSPARSQVFVLTNANGLGGPAVWSESTVTNPQARVGHSAVYDTASNRMIRFGGHFAFYGTDQNDTTFLSNANGLGGSSTWTSLSPASPPGIRDGHTATYDAATNRMTVYAGQRLISTCCPYVQSDYDDVWVLEHASGLGGTPAWTELNPAGGPPDARSGHSTVYDPVNNRIIVFGGSKWNQPAQTSDALGDVWELSHANGLGGVPVWTPILAAGVPPGPRTYQGAAFDAANQRMIVVGGRNDLDVPPTSNRVWILDLQETAIVDVAPAALWVGLKNSDDQGTRFDLRAQLYLNDTLLTEGTTRCVAGVTRNPAKAKEVMVSLGAVNQELVSGDILALVVSTRIGTNPDDTKCAGHNNAVGLRLHYDGVSRPSGFGAEITPDPAADFFLHRDGSAFFFDPVMPGSPTPQQADSSPVNFAGSNPWKEIGTWSRTLP